MELSDILHLVVSAGGVNQSGQLFHLLTQFLLNLLQQISGRSANISVSPQFLWADLDERDLKVGEQALQLPTQAAAPDFDWQCQLLRGLEQTGPQMGETLKNGLRLLRSQIAVMLKKRRELRWIMYSIFHPLHLSSQIQEGYQDTILMSFIEA
jgi:hypothetical protein